MPTVGVALFFWKWLFSWVFYAAVVALFFRFSSLTQYSLAAVFSLVCRRRRWVPSKMSLLYPRVFATLTIYVFPLWLRATSAWGVAHLPLIASGLTWLFVFFPASVWIFPPAPLFQGARAVCAFLLACVL